MYLQDFADAMSRFRTADAPPDAVLDAMVMFAYSDGRASIAEMQYIADLRFGGDLGPALDAIQISTERLRNDGDFVSALRRIAGSVSSPAAKDELFAYATAVLYADLHRTEAEGRLLDWLCEALEISGERGLDLTNQVVKLVEAHDPIVKLPGNLPLPSNYREGDDWPGFRSPERPAAPAAAPAAAGPIAEPPAVEPPVAEPKAAKPKPTKTAKPKAALAAKAEVAKAGKTAKPKPTKAGKSKAATKTAARAPRGGRAPSRARPGRGR